MKIGAVTIAYNEENMIRGAIEPLIGHIDKHLVLITETPFYGEKSDRDNTEKISKGLGATVIVNNWEIEHEMRNFGQQYMSDYDWIILLDADMWLTQDNIIKIKDALSKTKHDGLKVSQYGYWYDIDHVLENDPFMPFIAVRPSVRFHSIANSYCSVEFRKDIFIDHVNWVDFKDIYKKVTTYGHAYEIKGHEWFNKHYKNWSGNTAVTPCGKTFNIIEHRLPDELRKFAKYN